MKMLPHYPAVLAFAYQHRYITAQQLHRHFADQINSYTTAKWQARKLVEHGYLATARPARTGSTASTSTSSLPKASTWSPKLSPPNPANLGNRPPANNDAWPAAAAYSTCNTK